MTNPKQACKKLWQEVFGDDDQFIEHFLDNYYEEKNMLFIEEDNEMVSMLHLLPFRYNNTKAGVIYALATKARWRKKGYATALIQKAIEHGRQKGYGAIMLIPENDSLHLFYEKFGFIGRYPVIFHQPTDFNFGLDDKTKERMKIMPIGDNFHMPHADTTIQLYYDNNHE
ncbi:MAG: GNAT family N-acetyltransferase [Bacteroidaceae bacterium]|nr:GNAT family N-acetyltransferase [Bacteroidaceae bacterium]